jgi:hypothetical protein
METVTGFSVRSAEGAASSDARSPRLCRAQQSRCSNEEILEARGGSQLDITHAVGYGLRLDPFTERDQRQPGSRTGSVSHLLEAFQGKRRQHADRDRAGHVDDSGQVEFCHRVQCARPADAYEIQSDLSSGFQK